mgnify:CR=1 FL=1
MICASTLEGYMGKKIYLYGKKAETRYVQWDKMQWDGGKPLAENIRNTDSLKRALHTDKILLISTIDPGWDPQFDSLNKVKHMEVTRFNTSISGENFYVMKMD